MYRAVAHDGDLMARRDGQIVRDGDFIGPDTCAIEQVADHKALALLKSLSKERRHPLVTRLLKHVRSSLLKATSYVPSIPQYTHIYRTDVLRNRKVQDTAKTAFCSVWSPHEKGALWGLQNRQNALFREGVGAECGFP